MTTAVMIGVDPRKGSHTAVAIGTAEEPLGKLRVRASAGQAQRLVEWAVKWPQRTWAVEGAGGLGHLLAQQLVAAGELVLDVQPKLAARAPLLESGDSNKNDPDDARSVAVAALRSKARRQVSADDHAAVLRVRSGHMCRTGCSVCARRACPCLRRRCFDSCCRPSARILRVPGEIEIEEWKCLAELIDTAFDDFNESTVSLF